MPASTVFKIDVAEPAIKLNADRQVVSLDGTGWALLGTPDLAGVSASLATALANTDVDPVTLTGMLWPYQAFDDWEYNFTGAYARLRKSDYVLPTPAAWQENGRGTLSGSNADYFLESLGTNEPVGLVVPIEKNRGVMARFYIPKGAGKTRALEVIWGASTAVPGYVAVRIFGDGHVEIYKTLAGTTVPTLVGTGSLTSGTDVSNQQAFGQKHLRFRRATTGSLEDRMVKVFLIPCRGRELLIFSDSGGGFSHVFDDLASVPFDVDPGTITPAGAIGWRVPPGPNGEYVKASVQFAKLTYPTTGSILSPVITLRKPPQTGQSVSQSLFYQKPGYGSGSLGATLVKPDGVTAFVPNGGSVDLRVRMDFAGDGISTPYLYAVDYIFERIAALTNATEERNVTDYLLSATLTVPEDPGGVRLSATFRNPTSMEYDALVSRAAQLVNRPISLTVAGKEIFRGRTGGAPRLTPGASEEADRMTFEECQDRYKQLENYRFQESIPFDGLVATDVVKSLVKLTGVLDADLDIQADPLVLDFTTAASRGEWTLKPQIGDTAAQWLEKIWRDYFGTWFVGWYPTPTGPKFRFRSEASLGTTPAVTLDFNHVDHTLRPRPGYVEDGTEPECNFIVVTGYDARTDTVLQTIYSDDASQDPSLAPSARPLNWLGEPRRYGLVDPRITTQATASRARDILRDRLTPVLAGSEWPGSLLLKPNGCAVWRGDVVGIVSRGKYRILSFSGTIDHEADGFVWRAFRYVGKYIGALS